jgi:hypothetical protein
MSAHYAGGEIRETRRVVQLTPSGSACSVIFGTGITSAEPGSAQSPQLVVNDIDAARAELTSLGAEVSGVFHDAAGCSITPRPNARIVDRGALGSWGGAVRERILG